MLEPATAETLPVLVTVQGRTFIWTPEEGLDSAVVGTVERFIWKRANALQYPAAMAGISLEDLVQEGRLGALWAARKFLPSKRVEFLTYAKWWIHQRMALALSKGGVTIPDRIHRAQRKAGLLPSVASLDGPSPSGDATLADILPSGEEAGTTAERALLARQVREGLECLSERDSLVLQLRFGLQGTPHTLEEIGSRLGLSGQRIRQLEQRAMLRLRQVLSRKGVSR